MTLLAVAWEIDGTLVDSEPLHHRALVAATLDLDVDLSDLADQAFRGIHVGDVWIALQHRLPHTLPEDQWLADIEAYYADIAPNLPQSRAPMTLPWESRSPAIH